MIEPKLRFKADDGSEFPAWEEKKLSDIAIRVTRKNKDNITDIPLTISSADGLIDQRNFFNKVVASRDMSGYYLLKKGEFAYNKSYSKGYDFGSIKRLDLYDEGALSTLYICFALNGRENSDFYQKYFDSLSWYSELQKICAEGARNHGLLNVPTNDFFEMKLYVPASGQEQQKITDFLSTIDTVISNYNDTIKAWEERKKGVMQKLFSQEVRFKADDGSDFPDWEECTIADIFEFFNGKAHENAICEDGKYVVVNSKFISTDGAIRKYTNEVIFPLKKNDIVMVMSDVPNGKAMSKCFLIDKDDKYTLNQRICCLRTEENAVFFINQVNRNKYFLKFDDGVKQTNLRKNDILQCPISRPCLAEQQKIADCLSALDDVINGYKATLSTWEELKKGLLQQMFV